MSSRVALALSVAAIAAALGGLVFVGLNLSRVSDRLAALESRVASPPPPAPPPVTAPEDPKAAGRKKILEMAEKENQDHLDVLLKQLDLNSKAELRLKGAFADEFAYYADGVMRAFEALSIDSQGASENLLSTPDFKRGLEERIFETDNSVREILEPSQLDVFKKWRAELRKTRYELES